ncbi:hypothetical protein SAMN04487983_10192 [Streptomyces sp. yr375]|uniref:hypothetical protein n=1 Tax=Streptomyces sp. yr375 TaxID=1761906 RepID=UPI0008B0F2CB|nr:hypothetical protein [Streptomyces sp. yr375]SER60017.1 hypothetical protein SAMN04487983_10192 [Streptomyces sp. yr375]
MTSYDLKIVRLHCVQTAGGASDDVKMQIDGVKRWPPGDPEGFVTMAIGNYFDINERYTFHGDWMGVFLYGDTTFGADDRLGGVDIPRDSAPGEQTTDLQDEAHYELTYKVIKIDD